MKKFCWIAVCIALMLLLVACGAEQLVQEDKTISAPVTEAMTETSAAATLEPSVEELLALPNSYETPADMLGVMYNPFYDVEWPEGYTVYQACYESGEYNLYRLYLTAENSAKDVVTFMSMLVGDDAQESIEQSILLLEEGRVQISGTQIDKGLNADIEIEPTDPSNKRYEYVEGYNVMVTMSIDTDQVVDFAAILDMNFNADAIAYIGATDFLTENQPVSREINVMSVKGTVQAVHFYDVDKEYDTWKAFLTSAQFADNDNIHIRNEGDNTSLGYNFGNLGVEIILFEEGRKILISQGQNNTQQNIGAYVPAETLQFMGFDGINEDGACWFGNKPAEIYVSVNKSEWGANGDYLLMILMDGYDSYVVTYFPLECEYRVEIGKNDKWAKYNYLADGSIEPFGGINEADIRYNMSQIIGDDSADDLQWPIDDFNQYIEETFAMSLDALFELPVE